MRAYYKAQSPDYFALVRPQLLRQDNTFFAAPPLPELASLWAQPIDAARIRAAKGSDRSGFPLLIETTLAFFPGGLPAYWNAWSTQGPDAPARKNLLGVQVALTGRLHRVACYHWFNDAAEAARHAESLEADARHRDFVGLYSSWVAAEQVLPLRPAPVDWLHGELNRGFAP